MIGNTFIMEIRTSWKTVFIFAMIIWLSTYGMVQLFPMHRDSLIEDLEGAENVNITMPQASGGNIILSWKAMANTSGYIVLMDNKSSMLTPQIVYMGNDTFANVTYDFNETRYFAVMTSLNSTGNKILIGMTSTCKESGAFKDLMENPGYSGFTRGKEISIIELKGFVIFEIFSWFWMLAGFFMAYYSVSTINSDFEGKRMDMLLSTPMSRARYVIEKFAFLSAVSLVFVLATVIGLVMGVTGIGMTDQMDAGTSFMSMLGGLPLLMSIAAVGILLAVLFHSGKMGMGINFGFIIATFLFLTIAGFSKTVEWVKYLSIMYYWDYQSVIIDGIFRAGDFIILFAFSCCIVGLAVARFKKMDIPI